LKPPFGTIRFLKSLVVKRVRVLQAWKSALGSDGFTLVFSVLVD
jgi:hypothetical protein